MIAVIVQARMGSTRLPEKVMKNIMGKPMLWHVMNRLRHSKKLQDAIIATTDSKEDEVILEFARKNKIKSYAGSEDDVLDRYYQAAKKYSVKVIVRITADCPLIDPEVVDNLIKQFENGSYDYISNNIEPTYPNGIDVEVFSFEALRKSWKEARMASEREHVTPYIKKNPDIFLILNVRSKKDYSYMRWSVDKERDLEFVREVYKRLYNKKKTFAMNDVIRLLKKNPELMNINKGTARNEGYKKSLKEDRIVR